jgi:dTDP-4-amino-4,6-dideoxygalactose transaminase
MKEKIWMSSPHLGGNELKYIHSAFEGNWIAPLGPNVDGFENDLKTYLGTKEVAALSAGTAAIHLSLVLLGVQAGDEVLASSFTFSATVNPITYIGAKPVLIDSEKDTWNMSPELLETAIKDRLSNGIKPKAIIVVHLYGMPAKIDQIASIANRYDIPLIEDAAEALGSRYQGKALGTFGKLGILSFNGNKIITTSGGGALVSEDAELISKARFLSTQARDTAPHYQHSHIGFNYRMSNIVAGIGRGQMEVLDLRVAQRRANHQFYEGFFKQIESVELFSEPSTDYFSNYWLTTIIINPEKAGTNRETLRLAFEQENIETRPLWKPMHMQPIFHHCLSYTDGTAEHLFENGLCLPSSSNLTDESKSRILKVLNQVFTKH